MIVIDHRDGRGPHEINDAECDWCRSMSEGVRNDMDENPANHREASATRCSDCLCFGMRHADGDQVPECRHPDAPEQLDLDEYVSEFAPEPPSWCPLREGPLLVILRVKP